MSVRIFAALVLSALSFGLQAEALNESYAFALLGEPKYATDFSHFDYVNPAAPKGGDVRLAAIGTYDNFNRFATRGVPGERTMELYDTLFTNSDDEPGSYYPLIAESARFPADMSWMELDINARARFRDGSPITAADVAFTFNKFMTEGVPQFRSYYKGVTVKAISRLTVRIELPKANRDQILSLLSLRVLPESFWKNHKLNEPLNTPPLASGPYKISDYRLGQYITYQRVRDYWAANLPVNRGRYNFDSIRYDYYRTIKWRWKPSRPALTISASSRRPKAGPPSIKAATSRATTSSSRTRATGRRRIPAGWRSTCKTAVRRSSGTGSDRPGFRL